MKYIGIIKTDDRKRWSEWHSGSTSTTFRSDGFDTKREAKAWVKTQLDNINKYVKENDLDYLVESLIARFDEKDLEHDKFGNAKMDYMFNSCLVHVSNINVKDI